MRIDFLINVSPDRVGVTAVKAFIDYKRIWCLKAINVSNNIEKEGRWENSENYIHFVIPNIESERVSFENGKLFIKPKQKEVIECS
jgi:hypothetical protein